jgi:hypothetical protein
MAQKTLDFAQFQLAEKYTPGGATPDETITVIATSDIYNLTLQRQGGTLTKFRLTLREYTDTTKKFRVGIEDVASSSLVDGKMRYVLNIRKSGAGNLMIGLANDDDGTDNDDNIIASNLTDLGLTTFSKQSAANLVVGSGEYAELETKFDTAIEEINDESNLIASSIEGDAKSAQERMQVQQDDYETAITLQQDTFETEINSEFDSFVATQRQITAVVNSADTKLVDFSSGKWIDNGTLRSYAGATSHDPTDNKTLYYELVSGTGALASNEVGFTLGNFPIAKIVTDAAGEVTSIENAGAAYLINDNDIITEIDDTDSPYTVGNNERVILADPTSGTITINLPTATRVGQVFEIKNVGATNAVTVDPNGTETIDGETTVALDTQFQTLTLVSDGTNWKTKNKYTPTAGSSAPTKKVQAKKTSSQTLGALALITFPSEDLDTDGELASSGLITIAEDGFYEVVFGIKWIQNGTNLDERFHLEVDGSDVDGWITSGRISYNTQNTVQFSYKAALSSGQTIGLKGSGGGYVSGDASDKTLQSTVTLWKY